TDDQDASDGLDGWTHAVDVDGKPLALVPATAAQQRFNDAHNGDPCAAKIQCGDRETPWPGAFVVDPDSGTALIFFEDEDTEPKDYAFHSVGASVAVWPSPNEPAVRTQLSFGADEPVWD